MKFLKKAWIWSIWCYLLRTGWYNISREADLELPRISKEIPRRYKIKQRISELYRQWSIEPTPFGMIGVRQSLEKRQWSTTRPRPIISCQWFSPDPPRVCETGKGNEINLSTFPGWGWPAHELHVHELHVRRLRPTQLLKQNQVCAGTLWLCRHHGLASTLATIFNPSGSSCPSS